MSRTAAHLLLAVLLLAGASCQYVAGPLISISGISNDNGTAYLASQGAAASAAPASSFVKRSGATLQLGGVPYEYNGLNNYYMLQKAAVNSTRQQVTDVFNLAQQLNLTVLRMWAFTDGASQFAPLQPQLGMLDTNALTESLDYVIAQAEMYNIKLILTLTNYFAQYGGMQQYVEWSNTSNSSTVSQFYQDTNYQSQYRDYITAIVLRKNSITGRVLRDDPTILAWDIANEPANPGDATGDVLYNWLSLISTYVKAIDPNHLVYYGTPAFFGASTPSLLNFNGNYSGQYSPYSSTPFTGICFGEDWVRNIGLPTIDLASYHFYPNNGPYEFEIAFSQLQAHMQQASAAGKPMVVDEFNRKKPVSFRNSFLTEAYSMMNAAGSPVVGKNIWMPASSSDPDYGKPSCADGCHVSMHLLNAPAVPMHELDNGFEIYADSTGTSQALPAITGPTADYALQLATEAVFRNFYDANACVNNQVTQNDFVDGYQETLSIIQNQS